MRVTPGTSSFLPDLGDDPIRGRIGYTLRPRRAPSVEHTDLMRSDEVTEAVAAWRAAHPDESVKVNAFNQRHAIRGYALERPRGARHPRSAP